MSITTETRPKFRLGQELLLNASLANGVNIHREVTVIEVREPHRLFTYKVRDRDGRTMPVNAHELEEEPLAEWERELLESTEAPVFATGDIVEITSSHTGDSLWLGLRFPVVAVGQTHLYLKSGEIDSRPDSYTSNFNWPKTSLRKVEHKTGVILQDGDTSCDETTDPDVALTLFKDDAVGCEVYFTGVTEDNSLFGELSEVKFEDGSTRWAKPGNFVAPATFSVGDRVYWVAHWDTQKYGPNHYQGTIVSIHKNGLHNVDWDTIGRASYTEDNLRPLSAEDDMANKPRFEDFTFEAGQEIGSVDVLDELSNGTVVYIEDAGRLPITKLASGTFARVNQYWNRTKDYPAVDERSWIEESLSNGVSVLIGYVPA